MGALRLGVFPPGFVTRDPVLITLLVPSNSSLTKVENSGKSSVIVEVDVPILVNSGSGFLKFHGGARNKGTMETMSVELKGDGPVLMCAPAWAPFHVPLLRLALLGSSNIQVENIVPSSLEVVLGGDRVFGTGDVHVKGQPARNAKVTLQGSGTVVVSAHKADVQLLGSGDVYVVTHPTLDESPPKGLKQLFLPAYEAQVTGQIAENSVGNVYFSEGACDIKETAYNTCSRKDPPPSKLRCDDYGMHQLAQHKRHMEIVVSDFFECKSSRELYHSVDTIT
eukprot:CAMPEP_0196594568 /NCGR_PEP_ID=MMETSP1081-20130531/78699_1 /TAXON_ID=36882 /ORGANISM="Pyramimonas amylifera, Strain CCMP720" /LENGTH=279 /DNA_ID=CAMNT_0041918865 /DNA_START=322 /DNA_END=1161 /DNA_ORIENTATION=-